MDITESTVKRLLYWPMVLEAIEQSLISVVEYNDQTDISNRPISSQPPRQTVVTSKRSGFLHSMPCLIENYTLQLLSGDRKYSTLATKLVTAFRNNQNQLPPLSNILAMILLFNSETGQLECSIPGTEITAWRTAAASLVATKYLYLNREHPDNVIVSIIGCGVQGRIHAIGLCVQFNCTEINLWNRTKNRAEQLGNELETMRMSFKNKDVQIRVCQTVDEAVRSADIHVTATTSPSPLLYRYMIKDTCHINVIGAGEYHHAELDQTIYDVSNIYTDNWSTARNELATLNAPIIGEVGEVIVQLKSITKQQQITVFHSLGMGVEDATVGQLIYELYQNEQRQTN